MATYSRILVWRIPPIEEPGGHSPWGLRVRHNWATNTHFSCVYKYVCVCVCVCVCMSCHVTEKAMAPHSGTLAWETPWTEEPGRVQSMGSRRVGHDWATSLSLFTFMHWRRKWQPTPAFLPGESPGWGSLWAAVYGVTQSQTLSVQLKRLSSSSSMPC